MNDIDESKSAISTSNEQDLVDVDLDAVEKLAAYILGFEEPKEAGQLSIAFVDKTEMSRLNSAFRKKEGPTDVLSFSLKSEDEDEFVTPVPLLGNVIICPEVAMANAAEDKIETMEEIELLVAHGILHILGYSHDNETGERAMNLRQSELVKAFHDGDSRR